MDEGFILFLISYNLSKVSCGVTVLDLRKGNGDIGCRVYIIYPPGWCRYSKRTYVWGFTVKEVDSEP
jgi:hypothetical protein